MRDEPNTVVFSRPTPVADRMAFGFCGAVSLAPLLYGWALNDFAIPSFERTSHVEIGLLVVWLMASISLLAVACWGGTITVTIDRKARTVSEVAKVGPLTAVNKTIAFKDVREPQAYPDTRNRFIVEVPVKDRTPIQIGDYATRAEAEAVLKTVIAALDVAEPLAHPVDPAAINPLKAASVAAHSPIGPIGL
jgi:hypothetical protein